LRLVKLAPPLDITPAKVASEKRSDVPSTVILSAVIVLGASNPRVPASAINSSGSLSISRILGSLP
jgi:hypothetical protein